MAKWVKSDFRFCLPYKKAWAGFGATPRLLFYPTLKHESNHGAWGERRWPLHFGRRRSTVVLLTGFGGYSDSSESAGFEGGSATASLLPPNPPCIESYSSGVVCSSSPLSSRHASNCAHGSLTLDSPSPSSRRHRSRSADARATSRE